MNSIQETVHRVTMSYLAGRILTILFITNFSFKVFYIEVILDSVPVLLGMLIGPRLSSYKYRGVSIHQIVALVYSISRHSDDEMLLTLVFIINCYVAVYGDLSEDTFDNLALASATTVFLDLTKPRMLEEYRLTVIRYAFGTVTYVFMTCAGLRFCSFDNIMRSLATLLSVVSSVVSFVTLPSHGHQSGFRECMMFSSFLATFLKVLIISPSLTLAASVFGPLNIMLFLTYILPDNKYQYNKYGYNNYFLE